MAEENEVTEAEIQEAKGLGWADEGSWKGPKEQWVDARTFLEKGRHVLPIMAERNKQLKGQVDSLTGRLTAAEAAVQAANAAIAAIQESQEADVKEQVEEARKELKAQLAAASREGDHDQVADLTDQLTRLNTAEDSADDDKDKGKGKGGNTAGSVIPALHPEMVQWFKDNPTFMGSQRHVALANVIAQEMRNDGDARVGKLFMDDVATEVEKTLGTVRQSKSEAGNGGGGRRGGGGEAGKSFADLPADAKEACDRQAKRLVGPNRAHKDLDSWRKSYAKQYFSLS